MEPEKIFNAAGGRLTMADALQRGISRYMLYKMRDEGRIHQIDRGLYELADVEPFMYPDIVVASMKISKGVVCLTSALSFHNITTQIPHELTMAVPSNGSVKAIEYPVVSLHRFSDLAYKSGIEMHILDGHQVKIYSPEKTLADCFKFRNKIGMDVVLEALKLYRERFRMDLPKIMEYAQICRVANIMKPYLEASL